MGCERRRTDKRAGRPAAGARKATSFTLQYSTSTPALKFLQQPEPYYGGEASYEPQHSGVTSSSHNASLTENIVPVINLILLYNVYYITGQGGLGIQKG